ncbi:hypothetical protein [Brevundimonas sp.]|uniref:hypothetical protein n=1 Tax=Brevundimonas sp. TaxID=1871086 RepID=UPI0035AEDC90
MLRDLISSRVLFGTKEAYYLKYSLFYYYFVGRNLANNAVSLDSFIEAKSYYNLPGSVESISGLVSDNTRLLTSICDELENNLEMYFEKYVREDFDPFENAIWIDQGKDSERFWEPIEKSIEAGPRTSDQHDLLKTSLSREARTVDQQVQFEQFAQLEDNIFLLSQILADALKCSDSVDGRLKIRAVSLYYKTHLAVIQIGALLAPTIAENRVVRWGGLGSGPIDVMGAI